VINFVLTEQGDWHNIKARLSVPNTIFNIRIKEVTSRFNRDLPPRYYVVLDLADEHCYRKDVPLNLFDSLAAAQVFAEKQAHLLNGDD